MTRITTKLFRLRTNSDHYIEFQAGMDNFRFEFVWNEWEKRYALTIYKNLELKVRSFFIVWSFDNILDAFSYMGIGSLQCVSEDGHLSEEIGKEGIYVYSEINKNNIQESIFRWDYEVI